MDKTSKNLLKKQMTKKELKRHFAAQRVVSVKNTGTITMKSAKDFSRSKAKAAIRKLGDDDCQASFFLYENSPSSPESFPDLEVFSILLLPSKKRNVYSQLIEVWYSLLRKKRARTALSYADITLINVSLTCVGFGKHFGRGFYHTDEVSLLRLTGDIY